LVNMALKNIQESSNPKSLEEIKLKLNLPTLPRVIECFDISNLSYSHVVGAMVQFRDAKPDTSNYRRFEIKNFKGQNDFEAIHEVVYRRYSRLSNEKSAMPDLIIIDGGKIQLEFALKALNAVGLKVPIISLAKEDEEIYVPGLRFPIPTDKRSPMMLLIRQIRDNVHRFALSYNRKKRQMGMRDEFKDVKTDFAVAEKKEGYKINK
jgi:excinuclease ABC subunit C